MSLFRYLRDREPRRHNLQASATGQPIYHRQTFDDVPDPSTQAEGDSRIDFELLKVLNAYSENQTHELEEKVELVFQELRDLHPIRPLMEHDLESRIEKENIGFPSPESRKLWFAFKLGGWCKLLHAIRELGKVILLILVNEFH